MQLVSADVVISAFLPPNRLMITAKVISVSVRLWYNNRIQVQVDYVFSSKAPCCCDPLVKASHFYWPVRIYLHCSSWSSCSVMQQFIVHLNCFVLSSVVSLSVGPSCVSRPLATLSQGHTGQGRVQLGLDYFQTFWAHLFMSVSVCFPTSACSIRAVFLYRCLMWSIICATTP